VFVACIVWRTLPPQCLQSSAHPEAVTENVGKLLGGELYAFVL
jgi:hypothetical protein